MRQPKPYVRKQTGAWYVQIGKKQINLGHDKEQAFEKYHDIMAGRGLAQSSYASVAHLFDSYLTWLQKHRSAGTYKKSLHYLTQFARHLGKNFQVGRLEPNHVIQWIEQQDWSDSTGNDAVSIIQRAFNWAVKRGHLQRSPIHFIEGKPSKKRREAVLTDSQWKKLRKEVKDQQFGDLLDFMWHTGCRPLEARTIRADHVDLKNRMVVFPPSESKGKQTERVIFLSDPAFKICKRLVKEQPEGMIFRNTKGSPWTKDSINCRFHRLKKKFNLPMCAYAIRHSFATEGLKRGMDSLTLAQLMGHSDTSMLAKHYSHLARNPKYLKEQARNVRT